MAYKPETNEENKMGFINNLVGIMGKMSMESVSDHVRLENIEDYHTLVMKDGTLVSMLKLEGMFRIPGTDEIIDSAERMRLAMAPFLSRVGHSISFNFIRDPEAAGEAVERSMRMTDRLAKKANMDVDDVLSERQKILSERLVMEQTIVCLFTRKSALDKEEVKLSQELVGKKMKASLNVKDAQDYGRTYDALKVKHQAFLNTMMKLFKDTGQMADLMNVKDMMFEVRSGIIPETRKNKSDWSPNLPVWVSDEKENPVSVGSSLFKAPEKPEEMNGTDYSYFMPMTVDRQVSTEDAYIEDAQSIRMGRNFFSSFDMSVPPENLTDFNSLVLSMNSSQRKIPWRCTFLIESGGVQAMSLKERYLDFFTILSKTHNNRIAESIRDLREIDGQTDNIVKFRATFTTWSPDRDLLRMNAQALQNAVKTWGNTVIDGMSGDIMATTIATVPGATLTSTAPVGAGPLTDILCMSPIGRQASPWDAGPVMFRTTSGKPWAFQPGSSKQETWINLFCGTPGSGKSVLLNAINLGTILSSSTSTNGVVLPRISIIDIGASSSGLISLIREALPPKLRHLATFKRLSMSAHDAINVFDTPLGSRIPAPLDRSFLINFLSLICSTGTQKVSGQMTGLISAAIDAVYEYYSDMKFPKKYYANEEMIVDAAIREAGIQVEEDEYWWSIVDQLAAKGYIYEAEVAQRRAVPVLADMALIASQAESIKPLYGENTREDTGETTVNAFTRMVSEITRDFAILSSHTKLDFGSSRIISLDLMDVAPSGDSDMAVKQTALMYMLGRQICTREFYQKEDDFRIMASQGKLPKQYLDWHIQRCRENLQIQKVICFDEFHRAKKAPSVIDQVERDGREGRKFNISVNVISQLPDDFSTDMIDMASGMFICNARGASQDFISRQLKLSDADNYVISHRLNGPSRDGAPFWAMFMIKNRGQIRQELILTLGPVELWAFSTTAKDIAVRQALYEKIGPKLARQILAKRFPGGSAQNEIEARIARIENEEERMGDTASDNVIANLIDELATQAQML